MPSVYSLLGQILALLEKEDSRFELLGLIFRLKLLSLLGLKPKTDQCARCGEEKDDLSLFVIGMGGLSCRDCLKREHSQESFVLEGNDRKLFSQGDKIRLGQWTQFEFPQGRAKPLNRLLTQFACYHSHVRLPS